MKEPFKATLTVDGLEMAAVEGMIEAEVMNEIMHYAFMYRDEPWTKSFVVTVTKRK